jgi:hypothetical protein
VALASEVGQCEVPLVGGSSGRERIMARQKPIKKIAKAAGRSKKPTATETVFQFKITLRDSKPPIWRRIQVRDCTLDKLHEHIQTSMGWTNSHLHHFNIGEQFYGSPTLLEESMDEMGCADSTTTMLSHVVPTGRKGFRFRYEYDFGDSWEHEVLFEGCVEAEPGRKYPVCVAGKRACPPEDIGGVWGYADFLEAIGNKKHPQHDEMLESFGDDFDPDEFDPAAATKRMHGGLPDWS